MLAKTCQNCHAEYLISADTFGLAKIACPNCSIRIYAHTGRIVKRIAAFHTERVNSDNPTDWKLGDFAEILLSSGRARNFDIVAFMQALISLPEWEEISFLDQQLRKHSDISLEECLMSTPSIEQPFQLARIFNRLTKLFKRADNFGCSNLSTYTEYIRTGHVTRQTSNKRKATNDFQENDFIYEGMLNENGEAIGMDIPISIFGNRFIITGKLDKKRNIYEEEIISRGGSISSTVSQADYLVIGENHREKISRKAKEAQKYDIPAVTLASLQRALYNNSPSL